MPARAGRGPQFVECKTYRMGGHAAHDKYESYMPMEVLAEWSDKDPIKRLEAAPARGARDVRGAAGARSASASATRCARRSSRRSEDGYPPAEEAHMGVFAEEAPTVRA